MRFRKKNKESADVIFTKLKNNKNIVTDEILDNYFVNASILAESFIKTRQITALEQLTFLMGCVEKERKVLKLGINQYIFRDDIEEFLDRRDTQQANIKLIELEDYPRKIPEEIVEKIDDVKNIFDKMYVLFTDYSSTVTKAYEREHPEHDKTKDPILFGTFQEMVKTQNNSLMSMNQRSRKLNDKFYVIGDWVDEYCDLTLDKLVSLTSPDIVQEVEIPLSLDDINAQLLKLKEEL